MTIDFLPRSSIGQSPGFDPVRSLRAGDALAIRVIGMVDSSVARLNIMGQLIDVDTPVALVDGAEFNVIIGLDGNRLKLMVQTGLTGTLPNSVGTIFSQDGGLGTTPGLWEKSARAAINNAWLSFGMPHRAAVPNATIEQSQTSEFLTAVELKLQEHMLARFNVEESLEAASAAANLEHKSSHETTAAWEKAARHWPAQAAQYPTLDAAINLGALISLRLPNSAPIVARVERDQCNGEAGPGDGQTGRTWLVDFCLDAGDLGVLAINVRYRAVGVSVELRSGHDQTASKLTSVLPELKRLLEAANFTVETLRAGSEIK